jgi:hypothetical protein
MKTQSACQLKLNFIFIIPTPESCRRDHNHTAMFAVQAPKLGPSNESDRAIKKGRDRSRPTSAI